MKKDNWKKGERNNVTIALNVLYNKKEKINPGYVSKNISYHEKQVIVLMIPNGEGCAAKSKRKYYLAIKKISILSWKTMVIFIVWIVFIPLEQKTNLNRIKSENVNIKLFVIMI